MTRIIAGAAGSLRLEVPKAGTRPTSDRVREAVFSSLDALGILPGARVLDLYAGSGALGLEAISRGAARAVLVEKDAAAAGVAQRNAKLVERVFTGDTRPHVEVSRESVRTFLSHEAGMWDLVFVDPPYDLDEPELETVLEAIAAITEGGARLVVERSSRSPEPRWPDAFTDARSKKYGETTVWVATRAD